MVVSKGVTQKSGWWYCGYLEEDGKKMLLKS
jgi:hypothetical protein